MMMMKDDERVGAVTWGAAAESFWDRSQEVAVVTLGVR